MENYVTHNEALVIIKEMTGEKPEDAYYTLSRKLEDNCIFCIEKDGVILYQKKDIIENFSGVNQPRSKKYVKPDYTLVDMENSRSKKYSTCLLLNDIALFDTVVFEDTLKESIDKDGVYDLLGPTQCVFDCCGFYVDVSIDKQNEFIYWKAFGHNYITGENQIGYTRSITGSLLTDSERERLLNIKNPIKNSDLIGERIELLTPLVFNPKDLKNLIPKVKDVNEKYRAGFVM